MTGSNANSAVFGIFTNENSKIHENYSKNYTKAIENNIRILLHPTAIVEISYLFYTNCNLYHEIFRHYFNSVRSLYLPQKICCPAISSLLFDK